MQDIILEAIEKKETISTLKTEWQNSLTFPNDSYWDAQFDSCQHWALKLAENIVGYACVSARNTLLQFYITPKYLMHGTPIFEKFIKERAIKKAYVGTNNSIFFSLIMQFQKSTEIYGYLFKDMVEVNHEEREETFRVAEPKDLERSVKFQTSALQLEEGSEDWYRNYINHWISRGEFFVLEKNNEIIGTLEVSTDLDTKKACLGIIVSPAFRKQGYGSYLLVKGKSISRSKNVEPICSCDKDNIASRKAIEKSGFRILHLTLIFDL